MKVLFCGYRNPEFMTITEYAERALAAAGAGVTFFGDRDFFLPGRFRQRFRALEDMELRGLNRRLLAAADELKPDVFLACGGVRIAPATVAALRSRGIATALWTIDPLREDAGALLAAAPFYDRLFCGGSEAVELFENAGIKNSSFLPFACDPEFHRPQELDAGERARFGCDVCFVGSVHTGIYPGRVKFLEGISDLDLKVWGPGAASLPEGSPLKARIAGEHTPPAVWTKIYSAARIVVCMHYKDPSGKFPCYQASPRVYEALACGAFLLCDAQKDVLAQFTDGRHLAVFHDEAEFREKIKYYLARPEERAAIAAAGRAEALAKHTYLHRMRKLLGALC